MKPELVIAIVSWNTRDLLRACLASLEEERRDVSVEVWVIDNASQDGSADMVAEAFGWVKLIRSEGNLGFGRAVNEVARRTTSAWIASANADIEFHAGSLRALTAAGKANSEAAILAPRLVGPDGHPQQSVHAFPGPSLAVLLASGLPLVMPALGDRLCIDGRWDATRPREVDWAHGAFLLCRRDAWDSIGGFDERQWMYAEDLDISWRARKAGWSVRYVPEATLTHAGAAATTQAFGDEKAERFMQATFAWMTDRRGISVTYLYAAINLAGALARFWIYTPLTLISPARYGTRRNAARAWLRLHRRGFARRSALLRFR